SRARPENNGATPLDGEPLRAAEEFLQQCLLDDPTHGDALWCLAAVRWLRGDLAGVAEQAAALGRAHVGDARLQFFAGLCRLAAQDFAGVLETCARGAVPEPPVPPAPAASNGAGPR